MCTIISNSINLFIWICMSEEMGNPNNLDIFSQCRSLIPWEHKQWIKGICLLKSRMLASKSLTTVSGSKLLFFVILRSSSAFRNMGYRCYAIWSIFSVSWSIAWGSNLNKHESLFQKSIFCWYLRTNLQRSSYVFNTSFCWSRTGYEDRSIPSKSSSSFTNLTSFYTSYF